MLAFMRRVFIGSWLGRAMAVLIMLSFGAWGASGFVTGLIGHGIGAGNVANVAGHEIGAQEFERTYHRGLASAAQNQGLADPNALPFPERRQIAVAALQQLEFQAVVANAAARIGIVVPDALVRAQIIADKDFAGPNGAFSRAVFDEKLRNAQFTEDAVVGIFRAQSAATGLIEPIRVGGHAPAELVRRAFDYGAEQRVLDLITLPFSAIPVPPAPDEPTLRRAYNNNKSQFTAPEYRKVKLVLLSPETVAHGLDVSEADERKAYAELSTRYQVPEKRSVRVLIVPDAARAAQLATLWRGGVVWPQLQTTAKESTPIALDDATQASIPSPDLAKLVFASPLDAITGPTHTEAGWVLLKVTKITPPVNRGFDQVRPELHDLIATQRAAALMSPRVQKLQDAIAGGGLDAIPTDLGAVAALGTLDAQGLTPTGDPAPLPGTDAVRKAIIATAFATHKGEAPTLIQGPANSWYALSVQDITPSAPLAFVQAAEKVRAFWQTQAVRHADEQQAAALYAQAEAQHGLANVAAGRPGYLSGIAVRRGQSRSNPGGPVPANLEQLAFSLKPGASTMLETPGGFVVATITAIRHPSATADSLGYDRTRKALDAAMADDLENAYVIALLDRAHPSVDAKAIERVVGAPANTDAGDSPS
jgi:peptidyl-prolyl cis-trans isomerase D